MADSQRKTANILNGTFEQGGIQNNGASVSSDFRIRIFVDVEPNTEYTFSSNQYIRIIYAYNDTTPVNLIVDKYNNVPQSWTFTTGATVDRVGIALINNTGSDYATRIVPTDVQNAMLNLGSTALPYEPYGWVHSLRKLCSATETIQSGDTIYANGQPISTYSIKGNTTQSGTPTPSNPVDVQGVGNKTANLFNVNAIGNIYPNPPTTTRHVGLVVNNLDTNNDYYLSINNPSQIQIFYARFDGETRLDTSALSTTANVLISMTGANAIRFWVSEGDSWSNITNIMLSKGSTAQSYEPYGYKIPILTNQTTTNIYIGDNPLRKSLDGTAYDTLDSNGTLTQRVDSDGSVLATPIVSQITVPSIPTTDGANTITVDTTVQPSEFTATWTGWHDSSVQEYQGGVGNQKFDKSTAALGYRVLYTTGEIGELSSAFCSDFIPVVPNTTYTLNVVGNLAAKSGHLYALYNNDKEFVDTGTHASVSGKYVYTFTIPSGIAYIRFNGLIANIDETMLNEGETALPYEPYEYGWV